MTQLHSHDHGAKRADASVAHAAMTAAKQPRAVALTKPRMINPLWAINAGLGAFCAAVLFIMIMT